jgi:hypothetical protein
MNKKLLRGRRCRIEFVRESEGIEIASGAVKQINLNGAPQRGARRPAVIVAIAEPCAAMIGASSSTVRRQSCLGRAKTNDTKDPSIVCDTVDGRDPG